MSKCFVIQPFDRGRYDKRYEDTFVPAINDAGLEPYRVDRDPGASVPINDIQSGIESATICLAEITTDNPNVWFELGYAIASQRDVVLVCSDERIAQFPFDVQHRSILKYSTESARDFAKLKGQITSRLKALLQKKAKLGEIGRVASVSKMEGLEQYEVATLVAVAQQVNDPSDGISGYMVRQDLEAAGFAKVASTLGLSKLLDKSFLEAFEKADYNDSYTAYRVTGLGMAWLFANQDILSLRRDEPPSTKDEDIPF